MVRLKNLFIFCFFLLLPFAVHAQETNVGFVQGLWYSTEHIFAGAQVRIYVAVRNYTGSDITGTVSFMDGTKTIGKKNVEALDGRIIETWTDWDPTYGTHTISANLSRITLSHVGSSTQSGTTTSGLAQDTLFIDYDTDNDGIGNRTDTDNDGDGISDTQEIANGTDPLVYDAPIKPKTSKAQDGSEELPNTAELSASDVQATSAPHGIEEYLTKSPAEEALSSVTKLITQTKQNLDSYRTSRDQKLYEEAHPKNVVVNAQGFGPITRSIARDPNKAELPKFQGSTTVEQSFNAGKWLLNILYSWILSSTSFMLGHPMLVQLALLFLILFVLIKLAATFGRRKRHI